MYYGKKKKIIIISIVVALVLIIGGVFAFLFFATDIFKSSETLFYQYLFASREINNNTQLEEIQKLKQQSPYTTTGEVTFSYVGTDEAQQAVYDEMSNNLKVTVNGKHDETQGLMNTNLKLMYGTQELFNLDVAQNEDVYGVKSDEIITSYLGVKNENLSALAQSLGITGNIPNQIPQIDVKQLMDISDEEVQNIVNTYLPVLQTSISGDKFSKETNMPIMINGNEHTANAYRLQLTKDEVVNVITNILNTLSQDSVTLNLIATKAKILNLGEQYTQVNQLSKMITDAIPNLSETLQAYQDGLSIVIYEENKQVIGIDYIIQNQIKLSAAFQNTETLDELQINLENLSASTDTANQSMEMLYTATKTSTNTTLNFTINVDGVEKIAINQITDGAASLNNVTNTYNITVTGENDDITAISYSEQMQFVNELEDVLELDNTNCAVLNNYSTEQLQALIPAVMLRTVEVYTQKMQYIQNTINNTVTNEGQSNNMVPDITNGNNTSNEQAPIS